MTKYRPIYRPRCAVVLADKSFAEVDSRFVWRLARYTSRFADRTFTLLFLQTEQVAALGPNELLVLRIWWPVETKFAEK